MHFRGSNENIDGTSKVKLFKISKDLRKVKMALDRIKKSVDADTETVSCHHEMT